MKMQMKLPRWQCLDTSAMLMQRFDSTLSDDLNPESMRCPPMSIALQENATPTCVTTARRVPKHYEPESKRTVTKLIDKGVRLVTDFTALNNFFIMRRRRPQSELGAQGKHSSP